MLRPEELLLRLVLALVLGGVVGVERERLDWVAGLRTHMLVCLGATLIMIVSAFGFSDLQGIANVSLDPSRIAAQVVSGIGFLGAGTIIFRRQAIRGLTTAASLWTVAGVGLAVGGGLYLAAVITTVLALIVLAGVKPLERRLFARRRLPRIGVLLDRRETTLVDIVAAIAALDLRVQHVLIKRADKPHQDEVELLLTRTAPEALIALVDRLQALPGVRRIDYPQR